MLQFNVTESDIYKLILERYLNWHWQFFQHFLGSRYKFQIHVCPYTVTIHVNLKLKKLYELTLEPPCDFEHEIPRLEIQCLNH